MQFSDSKHSSNDFFPSLHQPHGQERKLIDQCICKKLAIYQAVAGRYVELLPSQVYAVLQIQMHRHWFLPC